jgi:thiosulfate reductase cytochrome b subunit
MLANRHFWRDLRTTRAEWRPKAVLADVVNHLKLKFDGHEGQYNFLQKLAYGVVLGVFLPGMVFTGLAISPGFEPAAPWLVDLLGGRQSARSLHFIFAFGLFGFFVVHVVLVLLNKPFALLRDMITGGRVAP